MTRPRKGDTRTFERAFTPRRSASSPKFRATSNPVISEPDDDDRLLVHGLLTATMPTKIGGDLEVLGRSMAFDFHQPVYTGETLTCEMEIESVAEREDHYDLIGAVTVGTRATRR